MSKKKKKKTQQVCVARFLSCPYTHTHPPPFPIEASLVRERAISLRGFFMLVLFRDYFRIFFFFFQSLLLSFVFCFFFCCCFRFCAWGAPLFRIDGHYPGQPSLIFIFFLLYFCEPFNELFIGRSVFFQQRSE